MGLDGVIINPDTIHAANGSHDMSQEKLPTNLNGPGQDNIPNMFITMSPNTFQVKIVAVDVERVPQFDSFMGANGERYC